MEQLKIVHGRNSSFLKTARFGIPVIATIAMIVGGTRLALILFGTLEGSPHTAAVQFFGCMGLSTFFVVNLAIGFVSQAKELLIATSLGMLIAFAASVMVLWRADALDSYEGLMIVMVHTCPKPGCLGLQDDRDVRCSLENTYAVT